MITEWAKIRPIKIRKPEDLHGDKVILSPRGWHLTIMPQ